MKRQLLVRTSWFTLCFIAIAFIQVFTVFVGYEKHAGTLRLESRTLSPRARFDKFGFSNLPLETEDVPEIDAEIAGSEGVRATSTRVISHRSPLETSSIGGNDQVEFASEHREKKEDEGDNVDSKKEDGREEDEGGDTQESYQTDEKEENGEDGEGEGANRKGEKEEDEEEEEEEEEPRKNVKGKQTVIALKWKPETEVFERKRNTEDLVGLPKERDWPFQNEPELVRLKDSPYVYNPRRERPPPREFVESHQGEVKLVSAFLPWDINFLRGGALGFKHCAFYKCEFTEDLSRADLVLFSGVSLRSHHIYKWKRPPRQRWVFNSIDPATKHYRLAEKDTLSTFNWTATYKLTSTLPKLMGSLVRRTPPPGRDYEAMFQRKGKLIAWFVSNCRSHSGREDYVKRMKAIAPVDIFGKCGDKDCGTRFQNQSSVCFPLLSSTYKFYLSFESAICKDYITEKYFKLFPSVDIIPVVRGGAQYEKLLPRGTFINAANFKTPEDLARYLVKLGSDKKAYSKMLAEKDKWTSYVPLSHTWNCDVCRKLHMDSQKRGHITNLSREFQGTPQDPECWPPRDL